MTRASLSSSSAGSIPAQLNNSGKAVTVGSMGLVPHGAIGATSSPYKHQKEENPSYVVPSDGKTTNLDQPHGSTPVSPSTSLHQAGSPGPGPFPATHIPPDDTSGAPEVAYPEGGLRANLVVLGAFCAMLSCFGLMNTIGTLQTYLSTHQLASYSPSAIGWIFSIYIFMAFFGGVQIGPIFDAKGPRWLIAAGTVAIVGGVVRNAPAPKELTTTLYDSLFLIMTGRHSRSDGVLAFRPVILDPLGPWYFAAIHPVYFGHSALVRCQARNRNWHCHHGRINRRRHISPSSTRALRENRIRMDHAASCPHVPRTLHCSQFPDPRSAPPEARIQRVARLHHFPGPKLCRDDSGSVLHRMGPLCAPDVPRLVGLTDGRRRRAVRLPSDCGVQCCFILR